MGLREALQGGGVLLSDGAWGTELAKKGFLGGDWCPELLNVEQPELLSGIARSYVDAGADIILSNTFGGTEYKLSNHGLEGRVEELNKRAVMISKGAANGEAYVLGSIGPTGEFLAPLGTVTIEEMTAAFARQIEGFVAGDADGILIETMTDLGEVLCALRAAKEHTDLPVICSMTFDKGVKGYATMMGVKPVDAVRELEAAGADAVGSNCGNGIDNIIEIAELMRPVTELPLWFKPNAGMPKLVEGETIYGETPEYMADRARNLIEAGADIIGGCCGTTPAHIRHMRKLIDSL